MFLAEDLGGYKVGHENWKGNEYGAVNIVCEIPIITSIDRLTL